MKRIHWLLVVLFSLFYSLILIGDYYLRLANIHSDNGIIAYANFFVHPELFQNDLFNLYAGRWMYGSITFWLPGLLLKYFAVPPEWMDWLVIFLQTFLIGPCMFRFAHKATDNYWVAYLTFFLTLAALPWGWNLANYPVVMQTSYYVTLAFPILIASVVAQMRNDDRVLLSATFAVLASLIHPITAAFLAGYYGCLFLVVKNPRNLILCLLCFVGFIPLLFAPHSDLPMMTHTEQWLAIERHIHANPWQAYPPLWRNMLPFWLEYFFLSLLGSWKIRSEYPQFFKIQLAAIGMMLSLAISHLVAYAFELIPVVTATGLRATSLYVMLSLPSVLYFIFLLFRQERPGSILTATLLILSLVLTNRYLLGFSLAMYLVWFGLNSLLTRRKSEPYLPLTVTVFLVCFAIYQWQNLLEIPKEMVLALLPIGIFDIGRHWIKRFGQTLRQIALVVPVLFLAVMAEKKAKEIGDDSHTPRMVALYQAQTWARENTKPNDKFITVTNWKTLSLRPSIDVSSCNFSLEVYYPLRAFREHCETLFNMLAPGKDWKTMMPIEINSAMENGYASMDESHLKELATKFNAKYAVREKSMKSLALPIAYQNEMFTIYSLPTSN